MTLRRASLLFACASATWLAGCGDAPTEPEPAAPEALAAAAALSPAPSNLTTEATSQSAIQLTWTDNTSGEAGFQVWRSKTGPTGTFALRTTTGANVKKWRDTGLTPETQYCYKVVAVDGGGTALSDFSATSCATTAPRPPKQLVAMGSTPTTVSLTWLDNSAGETGFQVWRSTAGSSGPYSLRATVAGNVTSADDADLSPGTQYCYRAKSVGVDGAVSGFSNTYCGTTLAQVHVRVVLFGDSNTDRCEDVQPPSRLSSYVSVSPRLAPGDAPVACSVAGKVLAAWQSSSSTPFQVVNHAIASTTTGGGGFGGPNRTPAGSPEARTLVSKVTRFEGEILGKAYPWSGNEPTNSSYPTGAIKRVNAFVPGPNDFVYVSMGTNDNAGPTRKLTAAQTAANLRWMVQQWTAAGRAADHFMLTTLPPRTDGTLNSPTAIPDRNALIRDLAAELGVHLIDLSAHVSDDDGMTWKSATLNIGDGVHYTEAVRAWIGDQVVDWMSAAPLAP